jgi:ATP/maltotriose-dependent transcriptional regulator MalT
VMASVHYGHAVIAREDGDLEAAKLALDDAAALVEQSTFAPQFLAVVRSTQGLVAAGEGRIEEARALHETALNAALATNDSPVIALTLVGAADLAVRRGDPERGARLLAAATAIRGSADHSLTDTARVEHEARAALGDPGYEAAYAGGLSITAETAVEAAGLGHAAAERPH